eukprot:COSAG05_NODE_1248_length_5406_cov_2.854720_2_plen_180_part_00
MPGRETSAQWRVQLLGVGVTLAWNIACAAEGVGDVGDGGEATEQSVASQQAIDAGAESGENCDLGRKKCFGDDPYYIASAIGAVAITATLVFCYCYCKVRDIGNIEREGHVDKVVTDNYGRALPGSDLPAAIPGSTPGISAGSNWMNGAPAVQPGSGARVLKSSGVQEGLPPSNADQQC